MDYWTCISDPAMLHTAACQQIVLQTEGAGPAVGDTVPWDPNAPIAQGDPLYVGAVASPTPAPPPAQDPTALAIATGALPPPTNPEDPQTPYHPNVANGTPVAGADPASPPLLSGPALGGGTGGMALGANLLPTDPGSAVGGIGGGSRNIGQGAGNPGTYQAGDPAIGAQDDIFAVEPGFGGSGLGGGQGLGVPGADGGSAVGAGTPNMVGDIDPAILAAMGISPDSPLYDIPGLTQTGLTGIAENADYETLNALLLPELDPRAYQGIARMAPYVAAMNYGEDTMGLGSPTGIDQYSRALLELTSGEDGRLIDPYLSYDAILQGSTEGGYANLGIPGMGDDLSAVSDDEQYNSVMTLVGTFAQSAHPMHQAAIQSRVDGAFRDWKVSRATGQYSGSFWDYMRDPAFGNAQELI